MEVEGLEGQSDIWGTAGAAFLMGQLVSSLKGSSGGSGTGGFVLIAHPASALNGSSKAASAATGATAGLADIPEPNEETEEAGVGLGLTAGGAEWTGHSLFPKEKGSEAGAAGVDSLIKGLE